MGRPPIKSTKALIKAELEANAKFNLSSKGIQSMLIDSLNRIDPLELSAVLAGTLIVYDIIKSVPEFVASAQYFGRSFIEATFPWMKWVDEILLGNISDEAKAELRRIKDSPDFPLYIKSFAISFIMIRHGGQIINGVGNMTGFIGSFLGLKVV